MRALSRQAKYEKRVEVVRLREAGKTYEEIARQTGIARNSAYCICKRYAAGGQQALKDAHCGPAIGQTRLLSFEQEWALCELIQRITPDKFQMTQRLWRHPQVGELIRSTYGVNLATRTVRLYVERWGFKSRNSARTVLAHSHITISRWLDDQYPLIAKAAQAEGAEIYWVYEGRPPHPPASDPSLKAMGELADAKVSPTHTSGGRLMITAESNRGATHWRIYENRLSARIAIDFMTRLASDVHKKVCLIVRDAQVYDSATVKTWLAANAHQIQLFRMPGIPHGQDHASTHRHNAEDAFVSLPR